MSARLARVLRAEFLAQGRPGAERQVAHVSPSHYRSLFDAAKVKAGLGLEITPHTLRHTYASQLLTAGVQLAYVARQLGHASLSTTERCYARWTEDGYREPMRLASGEVPADLLVREIPAEAAIADA